MDPASSVAFSLIAILRSAAIDIMASEERLHRRLGAGETLLQGELKAAKGELRVEIGASESRLGLRLDKILARIDTINHRFDKAKGRAS